ncbi:MAG: hypothetical protein RIC55_05730 [Pirellulaceae bacterium]
MARKNFSESVFDEWVERCRAAHGGELAEHPEGVWACAWKLFESHRESVEQERAALHSRRSRDEFWYADRFGLEWPTLAATRSASSPLAVALQAEPSAEPSPPPLSVRIDIEGVAEDDKESVGGLVIRSADGNDAPRKKITVTSTISTGAVILSRSNNKVRLFYEPAGGAEVTFNLDNQVFLPPDVLEDPLSFYVQGAEASATMRDVTLTVTHEEITPVIDRVNFTVLWATVSTRHTGAVSDDNNAKLVIAAMAHPFSSNMGYHLFQTGAIHTADPELELQFAHHGRGTEITGHLQPADFAPSQFGGELRLYRAISSGKHWTGMAGDDTDTGTPLEPGSDFSEDAAFFHDFDPEGTGRIYDWDGPGLKIGFGAEMPDRIVRVRYNFQEWVEYTFTGGEPIRASEKKDYYSRQSYKRGPASTTQFKLATAGGETTVTAAGAGWDADQWKGGVIKIFTGAGAGQIRGIASNTADTITVSTKWTDGNPADGSVIRLETKDGWVMLEDVANDNENADGTTKLSPDLQ